MNVSTSFIDKIISDFEEKNQEIQILAVGTQVMEAFINIK